MNEHEIISSLASNDRNVVHVALWTLKKNGIDVPPEIDFQLPYEDNRRQLEQLSKKLSTLEAAKLDELDESLKHHWTIYSPIWDPASADWK